jgi:hypothetical protein
MHAEVSNSSIAEHRQSLNLAMQKFRRVHPRETDNMP